MVAVAALGGVAVAAGGYSVSLHAARNVRRGRAFTVHVSGKAPRRSIVNVWLDRRKCASTAQLEGQRPQYRAGDSYFVDQAGGGARVTYSSRPYTGPFDEVQTAHAGTHRGKQYICAYVNELDAGANNSRAVAVLRYLVS